MDIPYDSFLVTGGAGFIGSHIVEYLSKHGKKVIVLDNLVSGSTDNISTFDCEFVNGSITDRGLVFDLVKNVDVVFNEAASKCTVCYEDPVCDMMVNGIGTLNVAQACSKYEKKLIHASSGSVMDGNPTSFYGISKWAGEQYILQHDRPDEAIHSTILRYYHVYGSRQNDSDTGGVIPIFIRKAYHNEPITIFGDGEQVRHFTSVHDVVEANMTVMHRHYGHALYNVVSNVRVKINELAAMIVAYIGSSSEIIHGDYKRGDIFSFPNIYDTQIKIGYIDNFRKELERTVDWYIGRYENEA